MQQKNINLEEYQGNLETEYSANNYEEKNFF